MKPSILKKIKKSHHKRHFLLLEMMVAVFILLICIAPTMRIYTNMYLGQEVIVRENRRDHLAHLVHASVTNQLYQNTIALGDMVQGSPMQLHDRELEEKLRNLAYECSFAFRVISESKAQNEKKPNEYLLELAIKMKDSSVNKKSEEMTYIYHVYVDHGGGGKDKKDKDPTKALLQAKAPSQVGANK